MLKDLELFPHNKWAYSDVMDSFKVNDRVCVIHPTGTGKSYIISAVCSNFTNILILAPNRVILNQVSMGIPNDIMVTYHTYSYLLKHDLCDDYDLIVLDEFHRCGALKWGIKVRELLDRNVGCKVFGTTATNIRNSDKRDMSIELFGGNIASMIGIGDAIKNNILPKPLYIRGLYTFDKVFNEKCDLINRSNKISSGEKSRRIERLKKMRKDWNCDCGIVNILKKHLYGSYVKKMIIFCDRVDSLDVMCDKISEWFMDSGLVLDCIDMVHHKLSGKVVNEKISKFRSYNGDGISVMLAVNMLNEGIHVHGVDCVMFLRKTNSNIIYLQQMGRSLITNAENKPIILDLVDNFTNKDEDVSFGNGNCGCSNSGLSKVRSFLVDFEVIDYIVDIRELINGLTSDLALNLQEKYIPFSERIKMLEKFVNIHRRLPKGSMKNEKNDFLNLRNLRECHGDNLRVMEIINAYSVKSSKADLIKFIKENKRLPYSGKDASRVEYNLKSYMRRNFNSLMLDYEFAKLYAEYNEKPYIINGKFDVKVCYNIVDSYGKKHGRLPTATKEMSIEFINARNCYAYLKKHHPELADNLAQKYSVTEKYKNWECCKTLVSNFVGENDYLPYSAKHGRANESWNRLRFVAKSDDANNFVKEMEAKYGELTRLKKKNERSISIKRSWEKRHKVNCG